MIDQNSEPITEYGYLLIKSKMNEMQNKLKKVIDNIAAARALGDLSENEEYKTSRESKKLLEEQMPELQHYFNSCIVLTKPTRASIVSFGLKIVITENETASSTYIIVGSREASIANGSISIYAPLVKQMIGKKVGYSFEFKFVKFTIKEILIPSDDEIMKSIKVD